MNQRPMTRREYLAARAIIAGANPWFIREAVASTAMEHPEWDMDEVKTWDEWEAS